MKKCTVIQQGYGPPTTHCLPHTGFDLLPLLMLAVLLVLAGVVVRLWVRR